jgi:ABC-type transport system involved in cytochrome c biogenesis permease subunit
LRLKRLPKPYSVELVDFRHDRYVGTDTPKNFSSEVRLRDPERHVDRTVKIWMNNPLRYGGDTLYQASFDKENPNLTVLQVVTNSGWMIPYVACMLIGTGMLAHFGATLFRFAQRKAAPNQAMDRMSLSQLAANWRTPAVWIPTLILVVFAGWVLGKARVAPLPPSAMQVDRFGQLPVAYQGRVQPFDTLARNALTVLSNREVLIVPTQKSALAELFEIEKKEPAIRWLLDMVTDAPAARDHRCLRIDNLEVLQSLGLERRDGFRYSLGELFEHRDAYLQQISLASEVKPEDRTLTQAKFIELGEKVSLLTILRSSFMSPTREVRTDTHDLARQDVLALAQQVEALAPRAPRPVPPTEAGEAWRMLLGAELAPLLDIVQGRSPEQLDPAVEALRKVLDAYAAGDTQLFNDRVADYQLVVNERAAADAKYDAELAAEDEAGSRKTAEKLNVERLQFETHFNQFRPFVLAMSLYVVAFVLAAGSWMGANTVLNRSANWLLWFTFLLHTAALVARIYISGRPPVTNLYSAAVFVGWAAVLFALVFEWIYRFGIGNLLAAMIGFPTLFIAHNLAGDGDTFQVLQAVLDTQFWLATHVVCITLGYATTILAGMFGVAYVILGQTVGRLDETKRQQLARMIYGTLCFATFFSFVGTILGGLWADDSWGRFWGWDPKENGALIIVLWNALVLHARWGGMIQRRGLALLSIFGNVVTAWSFFGTNAMGVGLHSYGFRSGTVYWLTMFVLCQLAIMLLGRLLPDSRGTAEAT